MLFFAMTHHYCPIGLLIVHCFTLWYISQQYTMGSILDGKNRRVFLRMTGRAKCQNMLKSENFAPRIRKILRNPSDIEN